ncbi:hypothetical protein KDA_75010 [Dictyobacter alpinus]|uniref:DUF6094 domain-containing protein n=1 Tax=Dictyobacter alpinus TaxID=2014873 RepID=A0A402BKX8_9CHLR|nr:hypothetical protein KDA_75010 [Dictyobacter alpinus]
METYGIEPQATLAQAAADRLNHLLHTSFFSTTLSNGESSDGGWQFIYLNSDYDDDTEQTSLKGRKYRLEFTFLQRATLKLCPGGVLVWVIPQYVLRRSGVAKFLAEHYEEMHCVRFPDAQWRPPESREEVSMYGQFKQVVLFLQKRPQMVPAEQDLLSRVEEWANMGALLPIIGTEEHPPQYEIPNAPHGQLRYFVKGAFDPDAAAVQVGTFSTKTRRPELGVWASDDYWSARFPNPRKVGLAVGHPMHKFKKGYVVVFAVAGLCNRAVLVGRDGRRILVKGHTRKTTHYNKVEDDAEIVEKVTDKFESSLWCTDLETGDLILVQTGGATLVEWAVEYETLSMAEFLDNFGASLMQQVTKLNAPRYRHASQVPWAKKALSLLKRQPLGKQYDTILAQVHSFVNEWKEGGIDEDELLERIAEIAEMASGKTFMAIATAFLSDLYACGCTELATKATRCLPFFPAVVLSPPIMAKKWKREIEATLPNARVVIVERFGSSQGSDDDDDEEANEQEEKRSFSDASADFRAFDPDFAGTSLGTVGSVDRIVARITYELEEWKKQCHVVEEENRQARVQLSGQTLEAALKPLPLKPCHVVIVTFSTAKLTPEWGVQYALKPARYIDRDNGLVKLLKRANGKPAMVPCCTNCSHTILDERRAKQQVKNSHEYAERLETLEKLREQRRTQGGRSGNRLNAYERRVQEYLYSFEGYRILIGQRETLRQGSAPYDTRYAASAHLIDMFFDRLRETDGEYRALLTQQEEAWTQQREATQRVEQCQSPDSDEYRVLLATKIAATSQAEETQKTLQQFKSRLLLRSDAYRKLIIAQDQLFRELQLECEASIQAFIRDLATTDEDYQQLLREGEIVRAAVLHYEHRLALHEEEVVHPISLVMTEGDLVGAKDHRVKRACPECGEPLWQYVAKRQKNWRPFSALSSQPTTRVERRCGQTTLVQHVGSKHAEALPLPSQSFRPPCVRNTYKRRYPIADYILDYYNGFFKLLIADEMHEGADGTALDFARQSLANACGRMLGLTGTLSNGYSSSLFRLFYLLLKLVRQEYPYEDVERWIDENGKRQMVQKSYKEEDEAGSGSDSKRKIRQGMPVYKEIAGVAPSCMGKVARCSTFTELRDVVPGLVKYREEVRVVPMGPVLGPEYSEFEREATRNLGKMLSSGDKSGLSPWFYAMLYYPNMPWLGWECRTKHGLVFGKASALPKDMIFPLERSLIDYVQEQQDQGLPVLIFSENTGVYDVQPRLKELLETKVRKRGGKKLKVVILRSNSTKKTMDREEWLDRQVKAGVDVLICNPRLVKVGLDLIAFPRIAYMSFPRSTSDLRQSARRSLRLGQQVDVEVVFFAYLGSMALRLLHLMARKTQASLLVEGQVASGGLVSLGEEDEMEEGDIIGQMAREMVSVLERGEIVDPEKEALELQEMFRAAAELEQQQNQAVDDESEPPPVQMEEIRQMPLSASASFVDVPSETADIAPGTAPSETRVVTKEEMVTAIPISVTDDPWAEPIVASAALDAWALLRQQYTTKRKGRRK